MGTNWGDSAGSHRRAVATHIRRRRRRAIPIVLSVVVLLAAGIASAVLLVPKSGAGCAGGVTPITIAAAPADVPALTEAARQWTATRPEVGGECVEATVVAKAPDEVAAILGDGWIPDRDGARPQVWVPDSSLWLTIAAARPEVAPALPEQTTSVASSPLVLALRAPVAQALGWPGRSLSWRDVIGAFLSRDIWTEVGHPEWASLRFGMVDPSRSTAGLATVLAILDPAGTGAVSEEQLLAALGFSQVLGAVQPDTATFFQSQSAGESDSVVAAFPAFERDVAEHSATDPAAGMVPVYDAENIFVADYPYAVLAGDWVTESHRRAAEQFRDYLLSPEGQALFAASGLRAPDYAAPEAGPLAALPGVLKSLSAVRANPAPEVLNALIAEWANLQRQVNLLAVLDTSGSMAAPVPGTNLNRIGLLQQTAATGFGLLPNTMSIGLWEFSDRGGSTGYRELVPFGPVVENIGSVPRRQALAGAVPGMYADGATPLYDTAYAAFTYMQQHWQPNSSNAVLLITDGVNEVDYGLSLDELVSRLRQEQDPERPVQIVSIAIGPDADVASLELISETTGGSAFVVVDPAAAVTTLALAFTGRIQ